MEIDYLIIGQGLAGSLLAWELIRNKQRIIIIDNSRENASLIAAGLINPVTGMRFVKAKEVDWLLPAAVDYYHQLSKYFKTDFFINKTMLRILRSNEELTASQKRFKQFEYQDYLSEIISEAEDIGAPYGLLKQRQCGYLLTRTLLNALKEYFISINVYIKSNIEYNQLKLNPELQWQHIKAKKIIFCEGHHATDNPWFSWLPFQAVKGEIITAQTDHSLPQSIINYGQWFIPLNENQFRLGATFDRQNLNLEITDTAKESLFSGLKQVLPALTNYNIINQKAGIRPTTLDKQPFVGCHPIHPNLIIFNGFGSKGSLQIPWHCQTLSSHLIAQTPLHASSNIDRYFPRYFATTQQDK